MSFEFKIIKELGSLSERGEYTIEVNLISWNGDAPKLDIRKWRPSGKPGKGIALSDEEKEKLKEILLNDTSFWEGY